MKATLQDKYGPTNGTATLGIILHGSITFGPQAQPSDPIVYPIRTESPSTVDAERFFWGFLGIIVAGASSRHADVKGGFEVVVCSECEPINFVKGTG